MSVVYEELVLETYSADELRRAMAGFEAIHGARPTYLELRAVSIAALLRWCALPDHPALSQVLRRDFGLTLWHGPVDRLCLSLPEPSEPPPQVRAAVPYRHLTLPPSFSMEQLCLWVRQFQQFFGSSPTRLIARAETLNLICADVRVGFPYIELFSSEQGWQLACGDPPHVPVPAPTPVQQPQPARTRLQPGVVLTLTLSTEPITVESLDAYLQSFYTEHGVWPATLQTTGLDSETRRQIARTYPGLWLCHGSSQELRYCEPVRPIADDPPDWLPRISLPGDATADIDWGGGGSSADLGRETGRAIQTMMTGDRATRTRDQRDAAQLLRDMLAVEPRRIEPRSLERELHEAQEVIAALELDLIGMRRELRTANSRAGSSQGVQTRNLTDDKLREILQRNMTRAQAILVSLGYIVTKREEARSGVRGMRLTLDERAIP